MTDDHLTRTPPSEAHISDCSLDLVVVILTFNEESNLPACLNSISSLQRPIFLVDSGSTDATLEVASRFQATVLHNKFANHSAQWAWAFSAIPPCHWVLGLDADQRLTPELQTEITQLFSSQHDRLNELDGIYLRRRQIFRSRWIKHGGYYPKYLLKLFRRNSVVIDEDDLVDHHFYVNGRTTSLKNDLIEDNLKEHDIGPQPIGIIQDGHIGQHLEGGMVRIDRGGIR